MTATPLPDAAREQLPEWGPAMRKVRRALKSGRSTDTALARYTGLTTWQVVGALGLLELLGEVTMIRGSKWRGVSLSTAAYGRKTRERLNGAVDE